MIVCKLDDSYSLGIEVDFSLIPEVFMLDWARGQMQTHDLIVSCHYLSIHLPSFHTNVANFIILKLKVCTLNSF